MLYIDCFLNNSLFIKRFFKISKDYFKITFLLWSHPDPSTVVPSSDLKICLRCVMCVCYRRKVIGREVQSKLWERGRNIFHLQRSRCSSLSWVHFTGKECVSACLNSHPCCVIAQLPILRNRNVIFKNWKGTKTCLCGEVYINPESSGLCFHNTGKWPDRGFWGYETIWCWDTNFALTAFYKITIRMIVCC